MERKGAEKKESYVKSEANAYIYYTGLGFQMIAAIGIFAYIGYKIDTSKGNDPGLFTAVFSLIGVGVSLVGTIFSITKRAKKG